MTGIKIIKLLCIFALLNLSSASQIKKRRRNDIESSPPPSVLGSDAESIRADRPTGKKQKVSPPPPPSIKGKTQIYDRSESDTTDPEYEPRKKKLKKLKGDDGGSRPLSHRRNRDASRSFQDGKKEEDERREDHPADARGSPVFGGEYRADQRPAYMPEGSPTLSVTTHRNRVSMDREEGYTGQPTRYPRPHPHVQYPFTLGPMEPGEQSYYPYFGPHIYPPQPYHHAEAHSQPPSSRPDHPTAFHRPAGSLKIPSKPVDPPRSPESGASSRAKLPSQPAPQGQLTTTTSLGQRLLRREPDYTFISTAVLSTTLWYYLMGLQSLSLSPLSLMVLITLLWHYVQPFQTAVKKGLASIPYEKATVYVIEKLLLLGYHLKKAIETLGSNWIKTIGASFQRDPEPFYVFAVGATVTTILLLLYNSYFVAPLCEEPVRGHLVEHEMAREFFDSLVDALGVENVDRLRAMFRGFREVTGENNILSRMICAAHGRFHPHRMPWDLFLKKILGHLH